MGAGFREETGIPLRHVVRPGTGMEGPGPRHYALVVERDPKVRAALLAEAGDRIHLRFEESLTGGVAARAWSDAIPPVRAALIELPDAGVDTLARLARFREANPGLPVVLSACYGGGVQLAAERLSVLSEELVYRPFDVGAVLTTLRGLCPGIGVA